MSGEVNRPGDLADRTEGSDELPSELWPHRTPDESTVGLPSSAEPVPASSGQSDFPRLQPGESLAGRFTILRFIARGGMGAVYEANDVMLRSRVALKVIRWRISTDTGAMERFRREVLLARKVSHPNVCRVAKCRLAVGDFDGAERAALEARTLAQRLEYFAWRRLTNAFLMRARAARGEIAQAIASLRADLADAESKKDKEVGFEVALALGEVEVRAGRSVGRTRLLNLEQEARSREFFRIARLAREALEAKRAAPPKPVQ
jgi:hypothetical protein